MSFWSVIGLFGPAGLCAGAMVTKLFICGVKSVTTTVSGVTPGEEAIIKMTPALILMTFPCHFLIGFTGVTVPLRTSELLHVALLAESM